MSHYLDPDIAYLLGLLVGRGKILSAKGENIITVDFPFRNPKVEGFDQAGEFIKSIYQTVRKRIEALVEVGVDIETAEKGNVTLKIAFKKEPVSLRNINLLLGGRKSHYEFSVPHAILSSPDADIRREFMRGYSDTAGNIRRSNRDQSGRHRVYIDVLNPNWKLPVELCYVLQNTLSIPVQTIAWGHPNIRDPRAEGGSEAWSREHQIKVYAEDFLKVGFYISHKNRVLKILAHENKSKFGSRSSNFCDPSRGGKRYRGTAKRHPGESADSLPDELRSKHFRSYWEICAAMGCDKALRGIEILKRQRKLFHANDD